MPCSGCAKRRAALVKVGKAVVDAAMPIIAKVLPLPAPRDLSGGWPPIPGPLPPPPPVPPPPTEGQ